MNKEKRKKIIKQFMYFLVVFAGVILVFWLGVATGMFFSNYSDSSSAEVLANTDYLLVSGTPAWSYNTTGISMNPNCSCTYDSTTTYSYLLLAYYSSTNNHVVFGNQYNMGAGFSGIGYWTAGGYDTNVPSSAGWYSMTNSGGMRFTRLSMDEHTLSFASDVNIAYNGVGGTLFSLLDPCLDEIQSAPAYNANALSYITTSVGDTSGVITVEEYGFYNVEWINVPADCHNVSIAFYDGNTYLNTWQMPILSVGGANISSAWVMPYSMDDFTTGQPNIRYWYQGYPDAYTDDFLYGTPLSGLALALVNNRTEYDRMVSNDYWASGQYALGYRVGYDEGYTAQNNLLNVIWSVFEFPFRITFGEWLVDENTGVGSYQNGLFTFTILGLDVRAFLLAILSICVVVAVVKFVLGNR